MDRIVLDARFLTTPQTAHLYLKKALELPEYYGGNLDALYDCLTDFDGLSVEILPAPQRTDYLLRILAVFADAQEDGALRVTYGGLPLDAVLQDSPELT